jgi:trans-aconitate methyltransferase
MNPAQVAQSYDQLAERFAAGQMRGRGIREHERALAFVNDGGRAVDVGCGSSGRIIDLLRRRGYAVEGVDISPRMLEIAKACHPDVAFQQADMSEWIPPSQYDFISAWDSFWHVPLAHQAAVLEKLLRALAPGGVCIFTMGGLDTPSEKTDTAMGPPMYYATLGLPRTLALLVESGCVCRHLEYDQHPELHVHVIVQRALSVG